MEADLMGGDGRANASHHHLYDPPMAVTVTLVASCALSGLACLWIFFTYWRYKVLRRHPNGLIMFRSICDMIFCVEVVASHLYHKHQHFPPGVAGDCGLFSGFSQYFGLAAELYVLFLAVDLVISVRNPFADYRWNAVWYHWLVHSISAVGLAVLMLGRDADGRHLYGQDNYLAVCWIREYNRHKIVNVWWWALFNVPVGAIYTFMILAFLHVRARLSRGLPASLAVRRSSLTVGSGYLSVYTAYWTLAGVWYMVCFVVDAQDPPLQYLLIFTAIYGLRGVVTLLVWLNTDEYALVRRAWSSTNMASRAKAAAGTTSLPVPRPRAPHGGEAHHAALDRAVSEPGMGLPGGMPMGDYAALLMGPAPTWEGLVPPPASPSLSPAGPVPAEGGGLDGALHRDRMLSDASRGSEATVCTVDIAMMGPEAAHHVAQRLQTSRWKAVHSPDLRPHLNVALRKEMLFYTTLGIRVATAVSHAWRTSRLTMPPGATRRVTRRVTKEGHADVVIRLPRRHEITGWSTQIAVAAAAAAVREERRWHDALAALAHDEEGGEAGLAALFLPGPHLTRPGPGSVNGGTGPASRTPPPTLRRAGERMYPAPSLERSSSDLGAPGRPASVASGGSSLLRGFRGDASPEGQLLPPPPLPATLPPPSPARAPSEVGMRQLLWLLEGGAEGGRPTPPTSADESVPSAFAPRHPPPPEEEGGAGCGPTCPAWSPFDLCCPVDDSTFAFHDLAPDLFAQIRASSGVEDEEYIAALEHTKREKFSEGASGAFLYFSADERFIVKTMTEEERAVLLSILPAYAAHLGRHPGSLLTRWLGCHTIVMYGTAMHFIVMKNVLHTDGVPIHERYDLKGSWVQRHRVPLERGARTNCRYCRQQFTVGAARGDNLCPARPNRTHVANTVLKDSDLNHKLYLPWHETQALGKALIADASFLAQCDIMDYSLLVGVHRSRFRLAMRSGGGSSASLPRLPSGAPSAPIRMASVPPRGIPAYDEAARSTARVVSDHLDSERAARLGRAWVLPGSAPAPAWGLTAGGMEAVEPHPARSPSAPPTAAPSLPPQDRTLLKIMAEERRPGGPAGSLPPVSSLASLATLTTPDVVGGVYVEEAPQGRRPRATSHASTSTPGTPVLKRGMGTWEGSIPAHGMSRSTSLQSEGRAPLLGGGGGAPSPSHMGLGSGDGGLRAAVVEAPSVYFIGVIDILQRFTWRKWAERAVKTMLLMRSPNGVSAVPPVEYAARFRARVVSQLLDGFVDPSVHPDDPLYAPYLQ